MSRKSGASHIEKIEHIAAYIGVSSLLFRQIFHGPNFHYRKFTISKRDGRPREIQSPRTYLKVIQWWILDNILTIPTVSEHAHGFCSHRSYVTNATCHLGNKHILNVDIKDFFPSISFEQVRNVFSNLGYGEQGAYILASLTTLNDLAPTGAPTSPTLGNLILQNMDTLLHEVSSERGITYTRYADDLTFSSQNWIEANFLGTITDIVEQNEFKLNDKKTKFMGPGDRMEITGVVINKFTNLPREWRNWARGIIHRAQKNPEQWLEKFGQISGIYGTLLSLDPEKEKKLTIAAYDAVTALSNLNSARSI